MTIAPSDFRITVTGNNPVPASFDGSAAGTTVNLGLGAFSVTETRPAPPAGLLVHTELHRLYWEFHLSGTNKRMPYNKCISSTRGRYGWRQALK